MPSVSHPYPVKKLETKIILCLFQNMTNIEDKEGSVTAGPNNSLKIGPTRRLLVAEMSLLDRLGLEEQEPMSSRALVLVLELLLLSGVGCRLLTMHLADQSNGSDYYETITTLLSYPVFPLDRSHQDNITVMHIISSLGMQVVLVPQLYIIYQSSWYSSSGRCSVVSIHQGESDGITGFLLH